MNSDRAIHTLTGAIALMLFPATVYIGVLYTNGDRFKSLRPIYASFDAAGQGLQAKSDVKIDGVTIGSVKSVRLVNGRALVKMEIDTNQQVPADSTAAIETKTLFGEKFVDIIPADTQVQLTGPFLKGGQYITKTDATRGTELEDVLAAAYPVLAKIDPDQLATVLDTLAQAAQGEGPAINQQLGNFQQLADVVAADDVDTQQLLSDLARLSNSLANDSPDIVSLAQSLNVVLPQVNARGDEVTSILGNLSEVSNDAANLLNANRATQDKLILEGGQILDTLVPRLSELDPTIVGIREFVQMLTEIGHVPYGSGTVLGAIKLVLGGGCAFGQVTPCAPTGKSSGVSTSGTSGTSGAVATTPGRAATGIGGLSASPTSTTNTPNAHGAGAPNPLPQVVKGVTNLLKLVGGLVAK
jgi:phospholipid/cholesterol/gamma-HCH transport system substrate-binding protein